MPIKLGSFLDEWIYPTTEKINTLEWSLSGDAQKRILSANYSFEELSKMQENGVLELVPMLGSNPFVALSGGADSQAACLLLKRAKAKFTAAIMVFNDNLNSHDVIHAVKFCEENQISYVEIKFDIFKHLIRDMKKQVEKYDCPSPQLTAHCTFFEMVIQQYAPSVLISGGNPPCRRDTGWEFISNRSQSVWMNFAKINKFPLIGNFLGFSLDIALPFMCMQPSMSKFDASQRYKAKITGMHRLELNVIPQEQKFTGFELVKAHFEEVTNDGWFFEKAFRLPNHALIPEYDSVLVLSDEISNHLTVMHDTFNTEGIQCISN